MMNSFVSRAKKTAPYKPKVATAVGGSGASSSSTVPTIKKPPSLIDFLNGRDYTGAVTLLEFQRANGDIDEFTLPWLAFAAFHLGDYKKACDIYLELAEKGNPGRKPKSEDDDDEDDDEHKDDDAKDGSSGSSGSGKDGSKSSSSSKDGASKDSKSSKKPVKKKLDVDDDTWYTCAALCYFYLNQYDDADRYAQRGPSSPLQTRILFHTAHRMNNEAKLMKYHQMITGSIEDQLSLASLHYLRNHFQEATDIYKRLLIEYRDYLALQVYVAMCYYKLDYYDVSLEILAPYLTAFPDSATSLNLKACNHYKLYDGKAAEQELKPVLDALSTTAAITAPHHIENDLVRHNLVVFRNGENALQVLPPLIDVIPEAKLNLVIYHLRHDEVMEAYELIKDLEPTTPHEYILKGVVNASVGQLNDSKEHLKLAQQFFQLVGASASECDTIPGRQCMASCFFLLKQFEDVLIYLNSIKAYSFNDSIFNLNHGIALTACGQYAEAHEALLLVTNPVHLNSYVYLSHLTRCLIMTSQPRQAWELYLKVDSHDDSYALLQLIASDCYRVGLFLYAAKAYDVLERLEGGGGSQGQGGNEKAAEYWEGKRGACCGVFQAVIAGKERKESMKEVIALLKNNAASPQAEFIIRVMKKWCNENGIGGV